MNYVCDDEVFPKMATFDDGRVVAIAERTDGVKGYYLTISPASEYPKPCGICDGVIQSKDDLDWHGYGNCREIPEPILAALGKPDMHDFCECGEKYYRHRESEFVHASAKLDHAFREKKA